MEQMTFEIEFVPRAGDFVGIIYRDGDAIGSVRVSSDEEKELWQNSIKMLNTPSESPPLTQ